MFESGNATNSTWLSINDVAKLFGITARGVRKQINNGTLAGSLRKEGKGKPAYYVELTSLPSEAQNKYASERSKAVSREKLSLSELKGWQRDLAFERLEILAAWERFAEAAGMSLNASVNAFVEHYRSSNPAKISRGTLFRWRKANEAKGPAGLAPAWTNGKEAFSEGTISPEAKAYFLDMYGVQNQTCMSTCYFHLKRKAKDTGWNIPSYSTMKRIVNEIPQPVKDLLRHGKKRFLDRSVPYIDRDKSVLKGNEIWESDHHQVDVAVVRYDGTVGFPWLTAWQDVKSNKITAWTLVSKPSGDSINISFHRGISEYGLPENVHLDNGKDYRSRVFTGYRGKRMKVSEETEHVEYNRIAFEGIYKDLGINIIWAHPYNARTKQIEGWFNTFEREFGKFFHGYRGGNVTKRPEKLKDEWREKKVATFDELKEAIQRFVNWFNQEREHTGKGMEKRTPNAVYFANLEKKRMISEAELSLLFSSWPKVETVKQQGIKVLENYYWNPEINFNYLGRKVLVRYSEDDISKIFVFDLEGRYLGAADKQTDGYYFMKDEEYKRLMRKNKAIQESTQTWIDQNIGTRMTDDERKLLVTSLADVKKKEPTAVPEWVLTKYADIVEEETKKTEKRKKDEDRRQAFVRAYTPELEPENDYYESQMQKIIKKFGSLE
jgi:putative transposase